jgi:hypothetical protein
VFVHWQEEGVAGHTVELVETGGAEVTGAGGIVKFVVEPGAYTIRIHGLTRGGPSAGPVDFRVTAASGETVRIEALDCLLCV